MPRLSSPSLEALAAAQPAVGLVTSARPLRRPPEQREARSAAVLQWSRWA